MHISLLPLLCLSLSLLLFLAISLHLSFPPKFLPSQMGVWVQRKKERKKFILADREGNLPQMTIFRTAWNNLVQVISELEPLEM